MTIQQAIEKAIEGGYRGGMIGECPDGSFWGAEEFMRSGANINDFFLDPLFWQSFGRAMWWHDEPCQACDPYEGTHCSRSYATNWQREWHHFIDHLIEGKDAESFFKEL